MAIPCQWLDVKQVFICSEVQRVADQMTEDNEEIKESIRAVQEQFAEAKFEAEKQADEIVTAFCEGQRKHFQHLISFRKPNLGKGNILAMFRMSVLHFTEYHLSKIQDRFTSPHSDTVCPTFNTM